MISSSNDMGNSCQMIGFSISIFLFQYLYLQKLDSSDLEKHSN